MDYYSSDYLKDFATRYDANVEIKGGNKIAQYYTVVNLSQEICWICEAKNNNTTVLI